MCGPRFVHSGFKNQLADQQAGGSEGSMQQKHDVS
jgi:hypothetical protein